MTATFDSLLKYINNLLKQKRPPVWRTIKTNIPWFENRVECIKGAREVLKIAGYSEERQDSLEFPERVTEPDKPKLYVLTAELHMAKVHLNMMTKQPPSGGQYPASQQWQGGGHQLSSPNMQQHIRENTSRNQDFRGQDYSSGQYGRDHVTSYGPSPAPRQTPGDRYDAPYRADGTQPVRAGRDDGAQFTRTGGVNHMQPMANGHYPTRAGGNQPGGNFDPPVPERTVSFAGEASLQVRYRRPPPLSHPSEELSAAQ